MSTCMYMCVFTHMCSRRSVAQMLYVSIHMYEFILHIKSKTYIITFIFSTNGGLHTRVCGIARGCVWILLCVFVRVCASNILRILLRKPMFCRQNPAHIPFVCICDMTCSLSMLLWLLRKKSSSSVAGRCICWTSHCTHINKVIARIEQVIPRIPRISTHSDDWHDQVIPRISINK